MNSFVILLAPKVRDPIVAVIPDSLKVTVSPTWKEKSFKELYSIEESLFLLTYIPIDFPLSPIKVSPTNKSPVFPDALLIELNVIIGKMALLVFLDSYTPYIFTTSGTFNDISSS